MWVGLQRGKVGKDTAFASQPATFSPHPHSLSRCCCSAANRPSLVRPHFHVSLVFFHSSFLFLVPSFLGIGFRCLPTNSFWAYPITISPSHSILTTPILAFTSKYSIIFLSQSEQFPILCRFKRLKSYHKSYILLFYLIYKHFSSSIKIFVITISKSWHLPTTKCHLKTAFTNDQNFWGQKKKRKDF